MENIEFRSLNEDESYDSFIKVLSWDKEKKFTDYNEDEFERYNSYAKAYGMYIENILIGYGIISRHFDKKNLRFISYIINPDYRAKGYGKILLWNLLAKLKEHGNTKIAALQIDDDNYESINFAQKNGFNKVGEINNTLIYKKTLKDIA